MCYLLLCLGGPRRIGVKLMPKENHITDPRIDNKFTQSPLKTRRRALADLTAVGTGILGISSLPGIAAADDHEERTVRRTGAHRERSEGVELLPLDNVHIPPVKSESEEGAEAKITNTVSTFDQSKLDTEEILVYETPGHVAFDVRASGQGYVSCATTHTLTASFTPEADGPYKVVSDTWSKGHFSLQPDDKQQITASIDPILIVEQEDDDICREVHTNFNRKVHSNNINMTTAAIKFLSKYLLRGFPLGGTVASVFTSIIIDELTENEEVGKGGSFYTPWGKSQCPVDGVAGQEYKVTAIIPVTISGMAPYEASIDAEYHLPSFYVDATSEIHYKTLKRNNDRSDD